MRNRPLLSDCSGRAEMPCPEARASRSFDPTGMVAKSQASPDPEKIEEGNAVRVGGRGRTPPEAGGLLLASYRRASSSSRFLVCGCARSARSRAVSRSFGRTLP